MLFSPINVLIYEEIEIMRKGIKAMLTEFEEIKTYCARTIEEAVQVAPHFKPHAVVVSHTLPGSPAHDSIKQLKERVPEVAFIVLMYNRCPRTVHNLMRHGCRGFVSHTATAQELYKAITTTVSGQLYFGDDLANDVAVHTIKKLKKATAPMPFELTNKDKETLTDVYTGLTNVAIAGKRHRTRQAVEKRVRRLLVKTKTKNRQQLIVFALRNDIITDPEI